MVDKEKNIKVLIVEPEFTPYVAEIPNDLKTFQEIVGGYIEAPAYHDDVAVICNDEGKVLGLPLHRHVTSPTNTSEWIDIIAGTFIISGKGEDGNFASLTQEQINKYRGMYLYPYEYQRTNITGIPGRSEISYRLSTKIKNPPTSFEQYRVKEPEQEQVQENAQERELGL